MVPKPTSEVSSVSAKMAVNGESEERKEDLNS